jgi:hypothetical protein
MDRSTTSGPECSAAVRTARRASLDLLSPATAGERGEPASAAGARGAVLEWPVLRQPSHGRHAGGQPQTHPAADAHLGLSRDGTRAPMQVRNGGRPHGRLLVSPLHHLKTDGVLSNRGVHLTAGIAHWEPYVRPATNSIHSNLEVHF